MAYIRLGQELPSGNKSRYFVFGGPSGLNNIHEGRLVPYQEVRDLFKTKNDDKFKDELGQRLSLEGEELDFVCERLFEERNKGEWDKPFEFE